MSPLIANLSVFFLGQVHVRITRSPARVADRSVTVWGKFSDGGCGAPGVPHPAAPAIHRALSPTHPHLCRDRIAIQSIEAGVLLEDVAGDPVGSFLGITRGTMRIRIREYKE